MSTTSRCKILVVDDDAALRDSLSMLLQTSGYEVSTAAHGIDALLELKKEMPAILISDLNMPQMSGFEFLPVVRRRFPQVSVIAMSADYYSGGGVPDGVMADVFYGKPGDPATLLRAVAELLRTSVANMIVSPHDEREEKTIFPPR